MAAVEPLGSADPFDRAQWLVVRGTLKEADLGILLDRTAAADSWSVTLDLCNLDVLTTGGCWTIRTLAEELWSQGRSLTVVFPAAGPVADALRGTGTIEHPRISFQGAAID